MIIAFNPVNTPTFRGNAPNTASPFIIEMLTKMYNEIAATKIDFGYCQKTMSLLTKHTDDFIGHTTLTKKFIDGTQIAVKKLNEDKVMEFYVKNNAKALNERAEIYLEKWQGLMFHPKGEITNRTKNINEIILEKYSKKFLKETDFIKINKEEEAILDLTFKNPSRGEKHIARELKAQGLPVPRHKINEFWHEIGLGSSLERVKAIKEAGGSTTAHGRRVWQPANRIELEQNIVDMALKYPYWSTHELSRELTKLGSPCSHHFIGDTLKNRSLGTEVLRLEYIKKNGLSLEHAKNPRIEFLELKEKVGLKEACKITGYTERQYYNIKKSTNLTQKLSNNNYL